MYRLDSVSETLLCNLLPIFLPTWPHVGVAAPGRIKADSKGSSVRKGEVL